MSEFEKAVTGLGEECGVFGAYDVDRMWLHQSIMACLLCSIEVRRAAVLQ